MGNTRVYVFFDEGELQVSPDPVVAGLNTAPTIQWKTIQPQVVIDTIVIEPPWPYKQPKPDGPSKVKTVLDRNQVVQDYKYTVTASLDGVPHTLDPTIQNEGEANGNNLPPRKP